MVHQAFGELKAIPLSAYTPRVSIIIPAYNCAQFLPETLASVFSQNYDSYEIIIVDDGSTDDLTAVLRPYANRLRYLWQENAGSAVARNAGLDVALGEFIVFLDADDLLLPGKLRQQAATLLLKPHLGFVHSGWLYINENGDVVGKAEPWLQAPILNLETWLRRKPVRMGAMMFRRLWLESVGGLDPDLRQSHDVDLIFRLALSGCQAEWNYRPTIAYRVHNQSTIRRNALKHRDYLMRVLDKFFVHPNTPPELRKREPLTRFFTLTWLSWHVYESGWIEDMAEPLQEAWQYSPYSPVRTIWVWVNQFITHLLEEVCEPTEIKIIWKQMTRLSVPDDEVLNWQVMERLLDWWLAQQPQTADWPFHDLYLLWFVFEVAVQKERNQPVSAEDLLDWWTIVWWHVLQKDVDTAVAHLRTNYQHVDANTLIEILQFTLIAEPRRINIQQIQDFWHRIVVEGAIPPTHRHDDVALYLSLFGQLALERQWESALRAIKPAFLRVWHPRIWPHWFCFARKAVSTITENPTQEMDPSYG